MKNPNKFGWQIDWPVFVKMPFSAFGKDWKFGDHFNWLSHGDPTDEMLLKVSQLYAVGYLHHDLTKEVEVKVGDGLNRMDSAQLEKLVNGLNALVKDNTVSTQEFTEKRCKKSKIDDKQRGLIRSFLRSNRWVEEDFYKLRDNILD